jgi:hypothetical protein
MANSNSAQEQGAGMTPGRRIRASLIFSLFSLLFSAVSLYETVLKQPRLTILAGCNWQYGRGPGSNDEFLIVPLTIANNGARSGAVIAIELTINKGGESKVFDGSFTMTSLDEKNRQLFAPFAIPGRQSATASVMFVQRRLTNPPLVGADGRFHAALKLSTSTDATFGFIDRLLTDMSPQARFSLSLTEFQIGAVLSHSLAAINACAPAE